MVSHAMPVKFLFSSEMNRDAKQTSNLVSCLQMLRHWEIWRLIFCEHTWYRNKRALPHGNELT
eukprot:2949756-Amphidinium_carterae.1